MTDTAEKIRDPQICKDILAQLKALDPMCLFAWGAVQNPMIDMGDGLKFKSAGMVGWKGYVYIQLDYQTDLYTIIFAKIRKYEWKEVKRVEGVHVEQLVEIIDRQVR